jgi:hypothetical protein
MPGNPAWPLAWSIPRFQIPGNSSILGYHTHVIGSSSHAVADIKRFRSLCIRDAKEAFSVRPRFPDHFRYMTLDVQDNEDQNLIRLFPGCVYLVC